MGRFGNLNFGYLHENHMHSEDLEAFVDPVMDDKGLCTTAYVSDNFIVAPGCCFSFLNPPFDGLMVRIHVYALKWEDHRIKIYDFKNVTCCFLG